MVLYVQVNSECAQAVCFADTTIDDKQCVDLVGSPLSQQREQVNMVYTHNFTHLTPFKASLVYHILEQYRCFCDHTS